MHANYLKEQMIALNGDREYIPIYQGGPDNTVEVSVKFDKKTYYSAQDLQIGLTMLILNGSIDKVFKAYEETYDFWEPQCIVKPEGIISAKISMRMKENEVEEV